MKEEQRAMPFKKTLLLLTISLVTFLTACNSGSTEEKIHGHLEEAVTIEDDFEKHQNEITDLEKKEQELYSEIIDLSSEEFDEIKQASQEATEIIDERTDKIELEKESIEASQDEFEKTDQLIDKLEDEKAQDKGKDRKSTRLNSSHVAISYAVFCLKKKKNTKIRRNRNQQL